MKKAHAAEIKGLHKRLQESSDEEVLHYKSRLAKAEGEARLHRSVIATKCNETSKSQRDNEALRSKHSAQVLKAEKAQRDYEALSKRHDALKRYVLLTREAEEVLRKEVEEDLKKETDR
jgi:chromosome segregation ATPase